MKHIPLRLLIAGGLAMLLYGRLPAQSLPCIGSAGAANNEYSGFASFNYGSLTNAISPQNRTSLTIGQVVVGDYINPAYTGVYGYWGRFLLSPSAPTVVATQGELLDRIQLKWTVDPLSPTFNQGFNIYRDSIYMASVDYNTRSYNDFNVIAGRPYNYEVRGVNSFGEGYPGKALGFQVPNGVVTGQVQTLNGNPVPGALVSLTPMQGFSAKFGLGDGAITDTILAGSNPLLSNLLPATGNPWTLTFWIKTDIAVSGGGILHLLPSGLNIYASNSGGHEGIQIDANGGSPPYLSVDFPDTTKQSWHHIALTYENAMGRLYLDGVLAAVAPITAIPPAAAIKLAIGSSQGWAGRMDELRIYHRLLNELDFGEVMGGTASSLTPDLKFYWKMDEEQGTKSFDLLKRRKLYFCGAEFDTDRPPVRTAGITNDDGYYRIESASYGTGVTFLAQPTKNFYQHRALKFDRTHLDFATFPDFGLTDSVNLKAATIELWVNSGGPDGNQCLLSKRWGTNEFRLSLIPNGTTNDIIFHLNGVEKNFGQLGTGYQHLAFTMEDDGATYYVTGFRNGVPIGNNSFSGVSGNWSDTNTAWIAGACTSGGVKTDYYSGLIDEIAVYDTTMSTARILSHFQNSRDPQEQRLRVYFALDEGNGNTLYNSGSLLMGSGTKSPNTLWTPFAPNQTTSPHIFTPATRQVTLNPSVTSVDQVDFTDRSTIAVTGFVRFKNTDCFAQKVEILVNGEPFHPAIFTDSIGRFVIDLDPGESVMLQPKLEDHQFSPASWQVTNVTSPIAGILFSDITTRTIKGQVAGGLCKKSIIENPGTPSGTFCKVTVRSTNGCLIRVMTIDNSQGDYEFTNLPPIAMTVAVTEHSDPAIKTTFEVQGGSQVDLTKRDTVVNFTYFAQPQIEIVSGLDPVSPACPSIVLNQGDQTTVVLKIKEQYKEIKDNMGLVIDDGVCYLDTAKIRIINGFADVVKDTTLHKLGNPGKTLRYKFKVGLPNPSPPYLQTFQVIATTLSGNETSLAVQGVVTGLRSKENTFTTTMPETPTLILRDPPGDASYSFLEENTKVCKTHVVTIDNEIGGGFGTEIHLGGAVQIVAAPLGVGTIGEMGPIIDFGAEAEFSTQTINDSSFQTCTSVSSKISTSDGDQIVGGDQGADVYMGTAFNIVFGFADKVKFDYATCTAGYESVLNVEPGNFATTFIYSEFQIKNNVMRYLDSLIASPTTPAAEKATYVESKSRWAVILEKNKVLKQKATKLARNISFDAGITYEFMETSEVDTVATLNQLSNNQQTLDSHFGYEFNKFGTTFHVGFKSTQSNGTQTGINHTTGVTTGYFLKDDDPGDAFTMDVAMDSVYKTPIFRVKAGQSSCPWETGTANREAPNLALGAGSPYVATDVPSTEAAVFHFVLGNNSASNEDWTYVLSAIAANNPNGAVIKLNGAVLNQPQKYIIPFGTSIPITLTVERGPVEYNYDSLLIALYSECEANRDYELSLPLNHDPKFFSPIYIGVHFIQPCSEVEINVPQQDWVVFPNSLTTPGPVLRITATSYDISQTDFKSIRVQYRQSDGNGDWINIVPPIDPTINAIQPQAEIIKANLGVTFTQFYWYTAGLADGPYEIRAVALCEGDPVDKPGYSHIIKGRIDRQPPSLIGTPEPSDGVYQVGDEVSFSFNKVIDCSHLIEADITQPNNVALYDAISGELIDIEITCYENKIILDPKFQNEFFENHILRAELHNIRDKTGNVLVSESWEFYVDRNELAWLTDSVGMTKYPDEHKTVSANIHNRSGYPVPFTINGPASGIHIVPNAGTLAPNEIRAINFEVDSTLLPGYWSDSIILHTVTGQNPFFMGGDEGLPLGVRVICRPPVWHVDPGLYEQSMTMVLALNIQGQLSTDPEDIVAAFVDDHLRGQAHVQYVPEYGTYLAFLTIYGLTTNPNLVKPIRLEIWDASGCVRYGSVLESFNYFTNTSIGTPSTPQVVNNSNLVLREIPFKTGWNWISFNLAFPNPAINPVPPVASPLASLKHPTNSLIRRVDKYATNTSGIGWAGNLSTLDNTSLFLYKATVPDTLNMLGTLIDPASKPITVVAGWNWIGYVPNYKLPINLALSSLTAQTGDLIKSQSAFAQYTGSANGWVGNLKELRPPNGYQLRLTQGGILTYPPMPPPQIVGEELASREEPEVTPTAFWSVDPAQYESSMTLIGVILVNGLNATHGSYEIGAFVGNEVRGSEPAIYVEQLQSWMFFLTVFANTGGEQLHFKLYDSATNQVFEINEGMTFEAFVHQGTVFSPVSFTLATSSVDPNHGTEISHFEVFPNPFSDKTTLRFHSTRNIQSTITVTDMLGRLHCRIPVLSTPGLNNWVWDGLSDTGNVLPEGIYTIQLAAGGILSTQKVLLKR